MVRQAGLESPRLLQVSFPEDDFSVCTCEHSPQGISVQGSLLATRTSVLGLLVIWGWTAWVVPARGQDVPDFSRDIRPILSDSCFPCHGPDEAHREGNLRLDTREGAFRVEKGRSILVPGRSSDSELYRRIVAADPDLQMPPPDSPYRVTPAQRELLRRWIDGGAVWQQHWSFEEPRVTLPTLDPGRSQGLANVIDRYVTARLAKEGLAMAPEADARTLLRRVTLDLTGLPPTVDETKAFLEDRSPNAYERLVDRLLASPRFGERMVWDWLDAARYADSNGYQGDGERTMWPWRDWAVNALNENLPFNQFTIWQLAGDRLPEATDEQRLATGFCRNHMINGEGGRIPEENRVDYVMDMTETVGTVWLGLTLQCARCHDHKYDAVTQRDYYGLFAIFNQTPIDGSGRDPQTPPILERPTLHQRQRRTELQARFRERSDRLAAEENQRFPRGENQSAESAAAAQALPENLRKILREQPDKRSVDDLRQLAKHWEQTAAAYAQLLTDLARAREERDELQRSIPRVMIMEDRPESRETFLLAKGLYNKPGEKVEAQTPRSLPGLPAGTPRDRLALARWLVSEQNPLTPRVLVNRTWQLFFGIGLVKTVEDFGVQGELPPQAELLDALAIEFRSGGWNWKALCRLIVTSATYRQDARVAPVLAERDPENRLLARGARFRLPAWMIRDQALAVSGLLVGTIGGEPVRPYQPPGVWEEATFGKKTYAQDHGAALYRRSVYTFWRRIIAPTMFFDSASRQTCTVKLARTNTPLHALATLNDITYVEAARALAEQVLSDPALSDDQRLKVLYQRCLIRDPSLAEQSILRGSLQRLRTQYAADPEGAGKLLSHGESPRDRRLQSTEHASWTSLCLAVLNLDEMLSRE